MKNANKWITFKKGIPKKNIVMMAIQYIQLPLMVPLINWWFKKMYLKHCHITTEIIPGFMAFYGNVYAEKKVVLNNAFMLDYAPIYIGEGTKCSFENMFITSTHDYENFNIVHAQPIIIGKNVWITSRCIILPGVTIGDGAVIGAGSVVTNDIPPYCLAAGNPAKPVKFYKKHYEKD